MAFSFLKHFNTRKTPQTEPIPGSTQVPNSAGGFAFAVDDWTRLERFLILGSEGGSFYATEQSLTIENAKAVTRCLEADADRTLRTIVAISDSGRAPKNEPAVLALAIAAGMGHTRAVAEALPKVCRTGTHLFAFAQAVEQVRGWGRGLRKAVAGWYEGKTPEALAFQVAKYQRRNGWSHRDLLRLSHPTTTDPARQAVLRWAVGGRQALGERAVSRGPVGSSVATAYPEVASALPKLLAAVDEARTADRKRVVRLIREQHLPRECVPTEHLNDPTVWDALLADMPLTALVRNLAKMTAVGLVAPGSAASRTVCSRLADVSALRKARLHPLAILLAQATYASGHGLKGRLSWTPVGPVVDALDAAFDAAFAAIEPSGQRTLIGLDVSGSMSCGQVAGTPLTPREAAAALALVTVRTEPEYQLMAFCNTFVPLPVSARSRLADVVKQTADLPFGSTDCSLPMTYAMENKLAIDTFVVLTDSETWAGPVHPVQALREYRQKSGLPAKLIVVGMVSNGFSIADPNDAGMLDVVGFDASAPAVMADFARG
jgi:60 kDa SS-A/Ro ribonucleoprotein